MRKVFALLVIGVAGMGAGLWSGDRALGSSPSESVSGLGPRCGEARWEKAPIAEQGHLDATVSLRCTTGGVQSLQTLAGRIRHTLRNERTLHSSGTASDGAEVWDLSHTFFQEGDTIWIREDVSVQESPDRLVYEARSKELRGSGVSAYVREIEVQASFESAQELSFALVTRIKLQRPWYAPALFFYPLAKKKVLEKSHRQGLELARRVADPTGSPLP